MPVKRISYSFSIVTKRMSSFDKHENLIILKTKNYKLC